MYCDTVLSLYVCFSSAIVDCSGATPWGRHVNEFFVWNSSALPSFFPLLGLLPIFCLFASWNYRGGAPAISFFYILRSSHLSAYSKRRGLR